MTPNQPSGMTPKNPEPRRSFKAEFKALLAARSIFGPPRPSALAPGPSVLAPMVPSMSQEQFSDAQRPVTQAQNIRTREVMDRVCATNNANVTRDYGTHTEDLSKPQQPPPLTAEDLADAKKLLDVLVVGKPGASYSWDQPATLHEGATPERIT